MTHYAIELRDLHQSFGHHEVLRGVSLSCPPGTITCLLARNGAGKTTTLRLTVGLRTPDQGKVLLAGQDVQEVLGAEGTPPEGGTSLRNQIGFLPERPSLYPHLTGREFLHFLAELRGETRDVANLISEGLERMEIGSEADQIARDYSPGVVKKFAFLGATLHEPDFLILDEPTGSLDVAGAAEVKRVLRRTTDRGGTVLFSTHIMELAERTSDRVAILHDGRILYEGRTQALLPGSEAPGQFSTLESVFLQMTGSPP